jgi:hypothetical protein
LLGTIYKTLEWMGLLATSQFHFHVPRIEVSHVLVFLFQSNEGGRAVTSVVYESCWILIEKSILVLCVSSLVFTPLIYLFSMPYLGARVL